MKKMAIDLYKSADVYGKGSIGRAIDITKVVDGASYDPGTWITPFYIIVPDDQEEITRELIKESGLVIAGEEEE